MVAQIHSFAFQGIHTTDVVVQVHIASGLPAFTIVGLPDKAVAESRERVRVAIQALGLALPAKRITVNLAPADLAKEGSHFDLAIALGVLVAMEIIPQEEVQDYAVLGELSLDGRILPVSGILPAAIAANRQDRGIICPAANGEEAAWAGDLSILAPDSLLGIINHVKGTQSLTQPEAKAQQSDVPHTDLAQVRGHHHAKRALEIAAAGGHNLLMSGPPGTGKSMLASCLPGILPKLDAQEVLEISMIASISGTLPAGGIMEHRPYRAPHHSASLAAMIGGGRRALPGEISLAHHGVLFLDEFPEYPRAVLEALRQPLENREVTISRVNAHVTYPADIQLIAAMNPCRCGYIGDSERACAKAPRCGQDYQSKLSGPLLDRFDLHIEMPMLSAAELFSTQQEETSETVKQRVSQARIRQQQRFSDGLSNASQSQARFQEHLSLSKDAEAMLQQAALNLKLSMRGMNRISRVAATIADLDSADVISHHAMAEALSYRHRSYEPQAYAA